MKTPSQLQGVFFNKGPLKVWVNSDTKNFKVRWTVHSKCCSTGSACPVAIGHRVSIQQEMLKERHSDLLGELCLFASVVPLPGSVLE